MAARAASSALPGLVAGAGGAVYVLSEHSKMQQSNGGGSPSPFMTILLSLLGTTGLGAGSGGGGNGSDSVLSKQPLIINMPHQGDGKKSVYLYYLATPVLVFWSGYFLSNLLPNSVNGLLPVTKKIFKEAVGSLGRGLLNVRDDLVKVRDQLREQFFKLNKKHDDLKAAHDEVQKDVSNIRDNVSHIKKEQGVLRLDLSDVHDAVKRCESLGLDSAEELSNTGRQLNYVGKGVRLLLHVVGTILPVGTALEEELKGFTKELEQNENKFRRGIMGDEGESEESDYNYESEDNDRGGSGENGLNPESFDSPEKVRPSYLRKTSSRGLDGDSCSGSPRRGYSTPRKTPRSASKRYASSPSTSGNNTSNESDGMITLTPGKSLEDQIGHLVGKFGGTPSPPLKATSK